MDVLKHRVDEFTRLGPKMDAQDFDDIYQQSHSHYIEDLRRRDAHFRYSALVVTAIWVALLFITYHITPDENIEPLVGAEKYAALFAFSSLLLSMIGRFVSSFWLEKRTAFLSSGVLVGTYLTQFIALMTNLILGSGKPVPVLRDPVFGHRIHALRWCEWTPLAFYMTFLVTGIDAAVDLKDAYIVGLSQGVSTLFGMLFAFTSGGYDWLLCLGVSFGFFFVMFPVLFNKMKRFQAMEPGITSHQMELYERAGLSYQLMLVCTIGWSSLVAMYLISAFGYRYAPQNTILRSSAFCMVWESTMDVILKNLYMNLVEEVHKQVFDDSERAERRLGELRRLMSAVWKNSSDVICVSVRGISGTVRTMVSPAYLRIYHGRNGDESTKAILFDVEQEAVQNRAYSNVRPGAVQYVEFSSLSELRATSSPTWAKETIIPNHLDLDFDQNLLSSLAGLIARAWNAKSADTSLTHKLLKVVGNDKVFTPCEANICRLENDSILMVVRDISERSKRFEAEKKMIFETTARKKDAEANRFTRHEVKNGLLAAIGLCESLKESTFQKDKSISDLLAPDVDAPFPAVVSVGQNEAPPIRPNVSRCTLELDKTLKDVLDTILSEAMARDVIHGVYEPKMERVEIIETLRTSHGSDMKLEKFPIETNPSPMPSLYFDPQLLKFIHRNAISNACKYGLRGGIVTTRVNFDSKNELFRMEVENLPGEQHDGLLNLGKGASNAVFAPGTRLHISDAGGGGGGSKMHSAGDGAWIMKKCAETLKGKAAIRFERSGTVFTFTSPARQFDAIMMSSSVDPKTFRIPANTWGIAIDDSRIQRKLLGTFLSFASIDKSRQIVMGETASEITGFDDFVVQLVIRHPFDYFLLIVDENLDIVEDKTIRATVSGSQCIESIRRRLMVDQERRVLGLVRSANDSSQDIAIYNSRAHGFISKAPIRKGAVLEAIAPLWEKRFMCLSSETAQDSTDNYTSAPNNDESSDFAALVVKELQKNLDAVDELCSGEEDSLIETKWPLIWEKLHCIKGDMLSSFNTPLIEKAVNDINSMRGSSFPKNFFARWSDLRSHITHTMKVQNLSGSDFSDNESNSNSSSSNNNGSGGGKRLRAHFDEKEINNKRRRAA